MKATQDIHYQRIARAIEFIQAHFTEQPSLQDIAAVVGLSPHHFQRVFSDWVGVSPKKFMQYLSLEFAKKLLQAEQLPVLEAAYQTGFSGAGRLHDLFVTIEGMTPGEFKQGGACLRIAYSFSTTPFGKVIVASTAKGVCHLFFIDNEVDALADLQQRFPNAHYQHAFDDSQRGALQIFHRDWRHLDQIKLHLKCTEFQLKVWRALLSIPQGGLTSYSRLASSIQQPKAARAVGSAIGSNPVAYLIPCHRVIQESGHQGGYRWGTTRKAMLIGWDASQAAR